MHPRTLFKTALFVAAPSVALAQSPVTSATKSAPSADAVAAAPADSTMTPATEHAAAAPADSTTTPATEPAAAPAATPSADTGKKEEPLSKSLAVGKKGSFQPGALIQAWYFMNHQTQTTSTFRLRRAELTARGDILPGMFSYRVTIDPAKLIKLDSKTATVTDATGKAVTPAEQVTVPAAPADGSILQDVYVTWQSDYVDASIGQFKIPVSWEGYNSSSKLLFPERSLVARQFGDKRDIGLRFEKKLKYFGYTAGVYNGQGQNHLDENNQKDVALRLEGYPIDGVMIGAVGYTSIGARKAGAKDRLEGDVRAQVGAALLQGEYIHGWDGPSGKRVEGQGFYAAVGYTFFDHLQPLVRVGYLDTDMDTDNDETKHYELGVNYYVLDQDVKFQTSLGFFDPSAPGAKTTTEFTFSTQVAF